MIISYKKLTASLMVSVSLACSLGAISPQQASIASAASVSASVAGQTGVIQSTVRLRQTASTSGKVLGYLYAGKQVTILQATNSYWYKVRTASGTEGYVSSASKYITVSGGTSSSGSQTTAPAATSPSTSTSSSASAQIEGVIAAGMKYLGTPYEFGSSRSNTSTFDCSDFVRQMFIDALNLTLPSDSRKQGAWIKENRTAITDISGLKRGDLMFFMSYRGSSASAYAGIDKSTARITHVGIYLGNNQILHTYSVASGGVRVDNLSASWKNRFLFGGSVIQ